MVPVRVFRKMSKYLKVSSSDKDKKASLSSVFLIFFTVYVAAADAGGGAAVRGELLFLFLRFPFFVHVWFTSGFLISLIIAQVFGGGKMTRTDV